MVPVVSLLALWGFATVTTAQDVARLREAQLADERVGTPVADAVTALQEERRDALRGLAAPDATSTAELDQSIRDTDTALGRLRLGGRHTTADAGGLPAEVADRVRRFTGATRELEALRTQARTTGGSAQSRATAMKRLYDGYTTTITEGLAVSGALTALPDTQHGAHARVALEIAQARELLSREDALLTTAHLTGEFPADRHRAFTSAADARRTLLQSATADLPASARATGDALTTAETYRRLTAAEDRITAAPAGRRAATATPAASWDPVHSAVRTALTALETETRQASIGQDHPLAEAVLTPAGSAVLLGLAAVAASLVISVRIGRGLVIDLVGLRNSALGIAHRDLPRAMRRLRAGEEIDIDREAPPRRPATDEIGQVGQALSTVHRAALGAASERAELAGGISGVFVNLARRSQVLVHRQLTLLDSMERRADDPNELGDLFRLDHLTTRMRRHAESLIILSGAAPGRAWRTPVPLTNVVRAAVSEIEDYARVDVRPLPETAVVGGAVADLTHLLAELIENAAQFSPPHTKVRVSGEPVGNGYALEIEDRGLGMGKQALADANQRIAHSEDLDLFDSDRLGLFVVSRLSTRHEIKVQLRPSPYGGITAVVLLPTDLLQGALAAGAPEEAAVRAAVPPPGLPGCSGADRFPAPLPAPAARTAAASVPHSGPTAAAPPAPLPSLVGTPHRHAAQPHTPGPATAPAPACRADLPEPAPSPLDTPTAPARPAPPTPTGAPASPVGPHGPRQPADPVPGLPRRTRQASLAPQLRQAPSNAPDPTPASGTGRPRERTPEEARARMAAYRAGWTRGGGTAPGTRPHTPSAPHPHTGLEAHTHPRPRTTVRGSEGEEG
ncbi:nitrate- and nitrite sensing domain-containing protein [Streptomyces sp. MUM 203J]|uniref:sensor histidine kinase n=1 Tax=Streptomyces sp. MUM 203J TaxID=2791990 RepID=UPI0027E442EF|nr:nitrate- and nitrite sensing domain-containing protein [Streptomyces sp. MUM 203J]